MAGNTKIAPVQEVLDFKLPQGVVEVRFLKIQRGNIINKDHVAFGGMLDGSHIDFPARKLENGNYANVLTKAEKNYLEKIMGYEEDGLSVYKKQNNFWDSIDIRLTKDGLRLDLSDPINYIKVKVLQSYKDRIASSLTEYNKNPIITQKFVIVWPDEESTTFNQTMSVQMEAFKAFGKIEDNEEAMKDLLRMYGIRPAEGSSKDWIKKQAGQKVQDNPKGFLELISDPNYKLKVLLKRGIEAQVIKMNGGLYQTKDGVNISAPNIAPTLSHALEFLGSNAGQDLRIRLESEIEGV